MMRRCLLLFSIASLSINIPVESEAQQSNPLAPFPVFSTRCSQMDDLSACQVGFATLIDWRGIFVSVGHVFSKESEEDTQFYLHYRGDKLFLKEFYHVGLSTENTPNDTVTFLLSQKAQSDGAYRQPKWSNFDVAFPSFSHFALLGPGGTHQFIPRITEGDNKSIRGHAGVVLTSDSIQRN